MVIRNIWTSGREDPSPRMEKIIHGSVHKQSKTSTGEYILVIISPKNCHEIMAVALEQNVFPSRNKFMHRK
jgi:plastocyanin domain-containing protein